MIMVSSCSDFDGSTWVCPLVADDIANFPQIIVNFKVNEKFGYSSEVSSRMNDFSGIFPSFKCMLRLQLETCVVNLIIT